MSEAVNIFELKTLTDRVRAGQRFKYVCFWNARQRNAGQADKSCFSQWFPANFQVEGVAYTNAEQFMMAHKARLFGDQAALARILAAKHPGAAKAGGRNVLNFNQDVWEKARFETVVTGNLEKFRQNPALGTFLLSTQKRVLVEASPRDDIWGIGLDEKDPAAENPLEWKGLNLLGFALMKARQRLSGQV